jgi:hypothetical protein
MPRDGCSLVTLIATSKVSPGLTLAAEGTVLTLFFDSLGMVLAGAVVFILAVVVVGVLPAVVVDDPHAVNKELKTTQKAITKTIPKVSLFTL